MFVLQETLAVRDLFCRLPLVGHAREDFDLDRGAEGRAKGGMNYEG